MTTYLVTLAIETDPTMNDPALWDWPRLLDTPYPAEALASTELYDATDSDDELTVRIVEQAHRTVHESQTAAIPPSERRLPGESA